MLAEFDLTERVAVITGGGTGIGKATARMLAKRGANIVIAGRKADVLEAAARDLCEETRRRCIPVPTDVRKPEQCKALMDKAAEELGKIDILINNAGGAHGHIGLSKMDLAKWDRDIQLNLSAAQYCSQAAIPYLKKAKGNIVNISSLAGVHGTQGVGAYSAAKAGLQMLTRVMAAEWGPAGVRVNCVAPGMTGTEKAQQNWESGVYDPIEACRNFPLRRPGTMDEVAQMIVFFASPAASYITGETVAVGGGPQIGGLINVDDD